MHKHLMTHRRSIAPIDRHTALGNVCGKWINVLEPFVFPSRKERPKRASMYVNVSNKVMSRANVEASHNRPLSGQLVSAFLGRQIHSPVGSSFFYNYEQLLIGTLITLSPVTGFVHLLSHHLPMHSHLPCWLVSDYPRQLSLWK